MTPAERTHLWRLANPGSWRSYYAKNKERVKASRRDRYWSDPEKERAAARLGRMKNPQLHRDASARIYKKSETHLKAVVNRRWRASPECKKWRAEMGRARAALWQKENPDRANAKAAERRALKILAQPPWVRQEDLVKFYRHAHALTWSTGIRHHVDHVYPLRHKRFTGLHVPANLQVITALENLRKGNRISA